MAILEENTVETPKSETSTQTWLPYVLPIALYTLITALIEPRLREYYLWVYAAKVVLVTGALVVCRRPWRDVRSDGKMLALGAALGVALCALWVGGEKLIPYPHLAFGKRLEFNPFAELGTRNSELVFFLIVRFFGLSVMVPAMEEIFWRSFLLRYLTKPEFEALPVDTFTWSAAAIMAAMFGVTHPEWFSAIVFAFAMALLLRYTRSLFACIVAHGVTNLALGIYVVSTGDWKFW